MEEILHQLIGGLSMFIRLFTVTDTQLEYEKLIFIKQKFTEHSSSEH